MNQEAASFFPGQARVPGLVDHAAKASHLGGFPRRMVLTTIGAFAKLVTSFLNSTKVHNLETLVQLVKSRPCGVPLLTVSNHMSTLDDPLMWGIRGLPITDIRLSRWTLAAEDICFTNPVFSYFFRLGKCIPVTRGAGIYQPQMNEALHVINKGEWLHVFPEGKLSQDVGSPMRRLKWGVASLIARAAVPPIVLPIAHIGFEKVIPEKHWFGRRAIVPLSMNRISLVVGEPMMFSVPEVNVVPKSTASEISSRGSHSRIVFSGFKSVGAQNVCLLRVVPRLLQSCGPVEDSLNESSLRCMYSHISEYIRCVLHDLVLKARTLNNVDDHPSRKEQD